MRRPRERGPVGAWGVGSARAGGGRGLAAPWSPRPREEGPGPRVLTEEGWAGGGLELPRAADPGRAPWALRAAASCRLPASRRLPQARLSAPGPGPTRGLPGPWPCGAGAGPAGRSSERPRGCAPACWHRAWPCAVLGDAAALGALRALRSSRAGRSLARQHGPSARLPPTANDGGVGGAWYTFGEAFGFCFFLVSGQ